MTPPNTVKYALLGFVALSIAAAGYKALGPGRAGAPAVPAAPAAEVRAEGNTAVVYYFYTDARCASCTAIETNTREAVEQLLADGYKGWRVEFRGVNIDDEANERFVRDYQLDSKSVVVQKFSGGKALGWGKLDRVWTLLGDKEAFLAYVASETKGLLDRP